MWIERALGNWRWVEKNLLHLTAAPMPEVVAVDAMCRDKCPARTTVFRSGGAAGSIAVR